MFIPHTLLLAADWTEKLKTTFFFYNSLWTWGKTALILLVALILSRLLPFVFAKLLNRVLRKYSLETINFSPALRISFAFLAFSVAFHLIKNILNISSAAEGILKTFTGTFYIISLGIFAYKLIPLFMQLATRNSKHYKETQKRSETVLRYLIVLVKVVLIIIALVAILSLWGVNVSGVLAGFGIGGLAVSLAAQDTLANLIGGMTIMTDRPFEIGDFVRIGTNEGTIEEIGFRSTKIRTLDMFLVVIPNSKVVNDSVVNISRLNKRRVRFELLLRRDTSPERVDDYVSKLRILIQQRDIAPGTDVLVVLQGVSGTAQIILVQYYISSTDYGEFLQEQEHVLLAADQLMAECGVESADPLGQQLQQNV